MIGFSGSYEVRRIGKRRSAAAEFLVASIVLPVLSGCALQQTATPSGNLPVEMAAGAHGRLMGGQQPISGASIYLVQTGISGYGTANSTNLLALTTSDANGGFMLPAFTCPAPFNLTMIEARGGNPGLAAGTNNSAIFELALLGDCNGLTASTFINITEVTTVAAAYTVRPFASGNNVGTSVGNYFGLVNAIATYNNLVNNVTGLAPGANVPTGAAIPVATINSLANAISACVNTPGPTSTACASLFGLTGVPSTGLTANTFNIAVAIASAPTTNVNDIFLLGTSSPPFLPALSSAPSDWTVGINYTSGNLNSPQLAMDIDAGGNVWVSTQAGLAGTVEELSNAGTLTATGLLNGTVDNPAGLAIDQQGAVIVTSSTVGDASVLKYTPLQGTIFKKTSSSFGSPSGVAIDLANNIIVGDTKKDEVFSLSPVDGSIQSSAALIDTISSLPPMATPPASPGVGANGSIYVPFAAGYEMGIFKTGLTDPTTPVCECGGTGSHISFDSG